MAVNVEALISGTTNFFDKSILQADELSITVVPASANLGAHSKDIALPAENIAISGFLNKASFKAITFIVFPLKYNSFPIDFSEATNNISETGKLRSSNNLIIIVPTIPVAPTTANLI